MPAYGFKKMFVPYIEDESKTHTIRALRKGRSKHAEPGDRMVLYFGMRTKYCTKIREAICVKRLPIIIKLTGIIIGGLTLTAEERTLLAWRDGFRPEGSTADQPGEAWQLMKEFWKKEHCIDAQTHFFGVILYWK